MSKEMIERALKRATDTKACIVGEDVLPRVVPLFREWFPGAGRALVVCDPRTRAAAGERVEALLRAAGIEALEHVLEPGGATFHADYRYAAEVRDAIAAAGTPAPVRAGPRRRRQRRRERLDEARLRRAGPALHDGRHGREHGRLHEFRGGAAQPRGRENHLPLPGAARRCRRPRRPAHRAPADGRERLRGPAREGPRRRRLDPRRRARRGRVARRGLGDRPGRAARRRRRPGGRRRDGGRRATPRASPRWKAARSGASSRG